MPRLGRIFHRLGQIQTVQWLWELLLWLLGYWGWKGSLAAIVAVLIGAWARLMESRPISEVMLLTMAAWVVILAGIGVAFSLYDRVIQFWQRQTAPPLIVLPASSRFQGDRPDPVKRAITVCTSILLMVIAAWWVTAVWKPIAPSDVPATPPRPGIITEDSSIIHVVVGSSTWEMSAETLRKHPLRPLGDWDGIIVFLKGDALFVNVRLPWTWGHPFVPREDMGPAFELRENEAVVRPPGWDRNWNERALEVVDRDLIPMFQLIRRSATAIEINGVFPIPSYGLIVAGQNGLVYRPAERQIREALPERIFKYPQWRYPGKLAAE